ncbi:helix-turn-helix domain-containing GNAT family N-acetyltransferase [Demequina capsici]|uniref:Helix-turn-helix domain-containing GNAT family N-acetyltransferase n=1 Tax=Demequina capsici TaxID=3075620 RepID=A0AA96JFS3_9MICO|nr:MULTISPECIES: helix-turn-helix domain-containing GNAT family N-acetyltransferase [unclassified Demequina]WNM24327.1 helix-turn-helix domain-containing GNAT family N-acetyltransferase [Demequina sp. OYTSA14]WNM27149.1 helix-turn-helix domain-containing GNAT family N-acetyltransferase [Demequina sp. PMTSA13]
MDPRLVQSFRQFQRVVTREVGALQGDFLDRGRPFAASRLLWEVGEGDVEIAALRARLGLDSGYASRLLRTLEAEGLVEVAPSPADARARVVRRTAAGTAEVTTLDALSDDAAATLLAGLDPDEQQALDAATRTVTRLLTRHHVTVETVDPSSPDARWCVERYYEELQSAFDAGYDPAKAVPIASDDLAEPHGAFLVARLHGQPVACGGVTVPVGAPAFLKRMWVAPSARGLGVGALLLDALEARAVRGGADVVRLDTNSVLGPACRMYESRGYVQVPDFNGEPHADRWYAKQL